MHRYVKSMHHSDFPLSPQRVEMILGCVRLKRPWSLDVLTAPVTSSQPLSSIRSANRFSVLRDVFTAAVSSLQASRTFNQIACEETGREMMESIQLATVVWLNSFLMLEVLISVW